MDSGNNKDSLIKQSTRKTPIKSKNSVQPKRQNKGEESVEAQSMQSIKQSERQSINSQNVKSLGNFDNPSTNI